MKINPAIFKAYDIRGKYPEELNEDIAIKIGNAAAVFLSAKLRKRKLNILVCRDLRLSSGRLKDAITRGIIAQGSTVTDAGQGTTPYFYFLMHRLKVDGGIMITASHNPADYNGFKILSRGGAHIHEGTGLKEIAKTALSSPLKRSGMPGIISSVNHKDDYPAFLKRNTHIKKIRAVIDAGGGSTVLFLPKLLAHFAKLVYKPLFFEPDGSFKNHPPNPLMPEAQKFVRAELAGGGFQFGVVLDGDGDRAVFFDEKGNMADSELIFLLLALEELKKNPQSHFILPVDTSKNVVDPLLERGAKIKFCRRGYVFLKAPMKRVGAPLGIEKSGHFYFRDFFFDDSALMAVLRVSELLSGSARPLSQRIAVFKRYVSTDEINLSISNPERILRNVAKFYKRTDAKISFLDGIKVEFPDWWFNIRPSNTEPLVRLVLEAKSEDLLKEKLEEIRKLIR